MNPMKDRVTVSKIRLAIFVPFGTGTPVHKNRPTHGLAYNVGCESLFRFDTGEHLICRSGDCIYLPKGSNYTVKSVPVDEPEGKGVYAINFLIAEDAEAVTPSDPLLIHVRGKDETLSAFMRAENAWRGKTVGYYEECCSDLYRILKLFKREAAAYSSEKETLERLRPALEYIKDRYTREEIPMSHLAALCGISEPYLRRLFHRAFSVSPAVYVRNLRIRYAQELLQSGESSVADVAMLSGFNDVSYFSRQFKAYFGISPIQYVKKQRLSDGSAH